MIIRANNNADMGAAGVISGIGKGVIGMSKVEKALHAVIKQSFDVYIASSTGLLLKTIGLKISVPPEPL